MIKYAGKETPFYRVSFKSKDKKRVFLKLMKFGFHYFLLCCLCYTSAKAQMQPVGRWREHLPFGNGITVSMADEKVFCSAEYGVFSVQRNDGFIERYSKINGLNDVGVRLVKHNTSSEKTIIVYNNSNIDVLYRNDIINIPYILRSNITGDKTVYHCAFSGDMAYLSTGIGIIKVDLKNYEVDDTYIIGSNGNQLKVNCVAINNNRMYAATDEGLKFASITGINLSDFRNWTSISNANGLPAGPIHNVSLMEGEVLAQQFNTLYRQSGNNWQVLYTDGWSWRNLNEADGNLLICQEQNQWQQRRVLVLRANGTIAATLQNNNALQVPMQATKLGNEIWIADYMKGLVKASGNSFSQYQINSPYGALDGEMMFQNNTLYVAGGSVNQAWNYQYNGTGFFSFNNNTWKDYNRNTLPWMDTVLDVISIAVDPRDNTIYAGSFGGGLVEYKTSNQYRIYKQGSSIGETIGDPNSYRIGGMAMDVEHNLWISNFGAPNNLVLKKADGSWRSFRVPFLIRDNMVGGMVIDDANQKWIQVPQGNGIFLYNHGSSIDQPGDDRWRWLQTGRGNGNLPSNRVNCMVKDKDGFIWVGTDRGVAVFQCAEAIFSAAGCDALQPVVQQDNFAGLLFQNEVITAMAVDGANRKWVGSRNGVWLISADGQKVIDRFTATNSPLLSNEIIRIAIDQNSGEVYFSTSKGICSYRGTAIEGKETNENVLVFPNPVPPNFGGTIAIRGVANNAIVKIAELNGRLVHQTRALGGQAVWNGRNLRGERVASGVYLVMVADDWNQEKTVARIVFIK